MVDPPRYQPLRALPARAYVPGHTERPSEDARAASGSVDAERWAEDAEYLWGVDLYNTGFFWEAHEVWEAAWRAATHDALQHAYLQGLIQCAAACLKGVQHEPDAARRIAARGLERLERVGTQRAGSYMGLDVVPFCHAFRSFVEHDPTAVARRPRMVLRPRPPSRG